MWTAWKCCTIMPSQTHINLIHIPHPLLIFPSCCNMMQWGQSGECNLSNHCNWFWTNLMMTCFGQTVGQCVQIHLSVSSVWVLRQSGRSESRDLLTFCWCAALQPGCSVSHYAQVFFSPCKNSRLTFPTYWKSCPLSLSPKAHFPMGKIIWKLLHCNNCVEHANSEIHFLSGWVVIR